jgi:hypothetical protein
MSLHDLFLSPNGAASARTETYNVTKPAASKIGSNFDIGFLPQNWPEIVSNYRRRGHDLATAAAAHLPPSARWLRRNVESTGVGIVTGRNFTARVWRKSLAGFRESETPVARWNDFSHACPRLRAHRISLAPRTEVPFFRHFSVMTGGIKTYPATPRKKLSGRPGWPNTACVLAVLCPRSSPGGHKI